MRKNDVLDTHSVEACEYLKRYNTTLTKITKVTKGSNPMDEVNHLGRSPGLVNVV